MITKKTYENFEDFDAELQAAKPDEIFYSFAQQQNKANPANIYCIISLAAEDKRDGKGMTLLSFHDVSEIPVPTSQIDADNQQKAIRATIDDFVKKLQAKHAGSFIRSGTVQIEG